MNGPQHYAMAERLLKVARENADADGDYLVAAAQAHATLALAAATSANITYADEANAWRKVTS